MLAVKFISLTLLGLTQEIIIGIFILLIFSLELKWKKVFPYAITMGFTSSISMTFLPQAGSIIYIVIFLVMILLALKFFYKFRLLKSFTAIFMVYFLKAIVNSLLLPIYKLFFRSDFNATNSTLTEQLFAQSLGIVIFLIIVLTVYLFKFKIDIQNDLSKKSALTVIINVILSIFLLVPNFVYLQNYMDSSPSPLLIYNCVSLILIVLINTFNFIKNGKFELLKQNVEFQNLYIKTLNEMIDSLRGFKHDHNNMLQVLHGYISVNDMEGLKNFHSQLLSESRKINNIAPLNSYIKDHPPIYGLLLSKISYTEIKNISFNITVMCKIKIANIKTYDFCKVLGILLDNAIEAAEVSDKKFVELSIRENSDKSSLFIEINNSCIGTVDTTSIFKDGYTTKKEHTGFGLWDVQRITSKYKNFKLHTNAMANYFSQKIEIIYNNTNG